MMELGGNVLGFSSADSSSATKGESVSDTVRVVSGYADIIAMRHPKEGAPYVAAQKVNIPIINAGDGGHNHPTQTLTDLMTIRREKGRLNDLTIGMCGDLKFGRTVHSLIKALSRYENIRFVMISPRELCLPEYIVKDVFEKKNIAYIFGAAAVISGAAAKVCGIYIACEKLCRCAALMQSSYINTQIIFPESVFFALFLRSSFLRQNAECIAVQIDPFHKKLL